MSEPEFYDDLVYMFRKIVGELKFSDQFDKLSCYKRKWYNINVIKQPACSAVDPITVACNDS